MKTIALTHLAFILTFSCLGQEKLMIFNNNMLNWSDKGLVTYVDFPSYDTMTFLYTQDYRYVQKNKSHYFFYDAIGPTIETHLKKKLQMLSLNYHPNLSDYGLKQFVQKIKDLSDLERAFHATMWVSDRLSYDASSTHYDLDAALRNRRGLCRHYTEALDHIFKLLDMETMMMDGTLIETREWHVWNMVNIDNDWYYIDATAFDATNDFDYVLMDKNFFNDHFKPRHNEATIKFR